MARVTAEDVQAVRDNVARVLSLGPATIRHIYVQLEMTVPGRIPENTLRAYMSQDARFRSIGKGKWELR